jgi:glycosyltransferase involved in cell wall biosynthesis
MQDHEVVYPNDTQYMIQPGVTILICCHNGAGRLPETLRHIAQQQVAPYVPWEVLIVDNKSTDSTALVARNEWAKYNVKTRFRVVLETELGLSHARARGFHEAQYDYVIMCDDDNWLAEDYVNNVYRLMFDKPNIGALGGFGKLLFEVKPPKFVELVNIFAAGPQGVTTGKVSGSKIYGAGCVVRKSAYKQLYDIGFKSLLVDRKGRQLSSGGDYELCYALAILGYDIWYDESLRFSHFITRERLTWDYFMRYAHESAECFEVLSSYAAVAENLLINKISAAHLARHAFYTLRRFIRISFKRLFVESDSAESKMLFFRQYIMRYKLVAYTVRWREMIRIHKRIFEFKERCEQLRRATPQTTSSGRFSPALGVTSFSKPSQQLQ